MTAVARAQRRIKAWRENPAQFAHEQFGVDLDAWQLEALEGLGGGYQAQRRVAMRACTGPGKSAVLAWGGWHRLLCFADRGEHPKGAALSGEGRDNLRDNLWAELAKWQQRSELLKRAFTWTKERIYANDHPETWFLSARSYPKDANPESIGTSLSGLHSLFPFILLDEIGAMPVTVGQKAEQIFTGGVKDGLIMAAGNPTSTTGLLYHVCTAERSRWLVIKITADPDDPKRTPRVSIELARSQIDTYGRDNPWVKATILGEFPDGAFNTLLGPDEVEAAMARHYQEPEYEWAQKRLGVDVARFGDDRTVLFKRQGLVSFPPIIMRKQRTTDIAARVAQVKRDWGSELEFVDDSGHWGHGVIDNLIAGGYAPNAVLFEDQAIDPRYRNKRAEMWFEMAEWVKRGGALPSLPELVRELTAPTYTFVNGKIQLEPKDMIKKRIGVSPDLGDALCFVGGTLISTPSGRRPIESIEPGDMVLTPMGPRAVLKRWESVSDTLTRVRFSNGAELQGRGEHEIFTWDSGWVRLDALSMTNVIEIETAFSSVAWWITRKLFTGERRTGFKARAGIISQAGKMRRRDFFIAESGWTTMARFLKGIISTTRTAIGETTGLRTLSLSVAGSTPKSTCSSGWSVPSTARSLSEALSLAGRQQPSGTEASQAEGGTASTASGPGKGAKGSVLPNRAFTAARALKPSFHHGPSFAVGNASGITTTAKIKRLLAPVLCAARFFTSISTASRRVVPVLVRTDTVKSERIYNLSVDHENVYYANGVLVANCLTFALPDLPGQTERDRVLSGFGYSSTKMAVEWEPPMD